MGFLTTTLFPGGKCIIKKEPPASIKKNYQLGFLLEDLMAIFWKFKKFKANGTSFVKFSPSTGISGYDPANQGTGTYSNSINNNLGTIWDNTSNMSGVLCTTAPIQLSFNNSSYLYGKPYDCYDISCTTNKTVTAQNQLSIQISSPIYNNGVLYYPYLSLFCIQTVGPGLIGGENQGAIVASTENYPATKTGTVTFSVNSNNYVLKPGLPSSYPIDEVSLNLTIRMASEREAN